MTPAFKHRLLGTAILVMAGIIFLPDLLDGEKQIVKDDFKVIPNRPEFKGVMQQQVMDQQPFEQAVADVTAVPVDEQPLDASEAANDDNVDDSLPSQQYTQVTVSANDTTPKRVANPALAQSGWVVRVGSFSKEQNANALVSKLRQAGFVTFTRNITNANGIKLTSVLVGPELRKDLLEQQLPKLQQLTGIERLSMVSYQPTENN
ncbi:SPOR domain-containing protein [Rheinheimera baltica]|uniref:SPOR domain-containing protein n=1 Tax=Rheinheimera baltica TaxID=67576 RepID=UPI00273DC65B|nr:SPOR domain-containing protein [Rheinheimera baltica]MDP5191004.1 SPOR domain-containing protein [Rheinheimera baltica]